MIIDAIVYSTVSTLLAIIAGVGAVWGSIWFFFYRRKSKKYNVNIYKLIHANKDENPMLIFDCKDILKEKYINKNKTSYFELLKEKKIVSPPTPDVIYTQYKGKKSIDTIDLIRSTDNPFIFIPFSKRLSIPNTDSPAEFAIKFNDEDVIAKLMDFDIEMSKNAAIATRDLVYADKLGFWDKIAPVLGLILLIVAVVTVGWMSFDFLTKVSTSLIGPMQKVAAELAASV